MKIPKPYCKKLALLLSLLLGEASYASFSPLTSEELESLNAKSFYMKQKDSNNFLKVGPDNPEISSERNLLSLWTIRKTESQFVILEHSSNKKLVSNDGIISLGATGARWKIERMVLDGGTDYYRFEHNGTYLSTLNDRIPITTNDPAELNAQWHLARPQISLTTENVPDANAVSILPYRPLIALTVTGLNSEDIGSKIRAFTATNNINQADLATLQIQRIQDNDLTALGRLFPNERRKPKREGSLTAADLGIGNRVSITTLDSPVSASSSARPNRSLIVGTLPPLGWFGTNPQIQLNVTKTGDTFGEIERYLNQYNIGSADVTAINLTGFGKATRVERDALRTRIHTRWPSLKPSFDGRAFPLTVGQNLSVNERYFLSAEGRQIEGQPIIDLAVEGLNSEDIGSKIRAFTATNNINQADLATLQIQRIQDNDLAALGRLFPNERRKPKREGSLTAADLGIGNRVSITTLDSPVSASSSARPNRSLIVGTLPPLGWFGTNPQIQLEMNGADNAEASIINYLDQYNIETTNVTRIHITNPGSIDQNARNRLSEALQHRYENARIDIDLPPVLRVECNVGHGTEPQDINRILIQHRRDTITELVINGIGNHRNHTWKGLEILNDFSILTKLKFHGLRVEDGIKNLTCSSLTEVDLGHPNVHSMSVMREFLGRHRGIQTINYNGKSYNRNNILCQAFLDHP